MIGQHQSQLDTPVLCLDLDLLEQNVQTMFREISEHGKQWRPHVSCHMSRDIAKLVLDAGATGVSVSTVFEAEQLVSAGIPDVLIANLVIDAQKLQRVAKLCHIGNPIVVCDHFAQAEALSGVCQHFGKKCRVLIDVDLGMHRTGIRPGPDAARLAQGINSLPGINLVGAMGYEGHLFSLTNPELKHARIMTAMSLLEELRNFMLKNGICCNILSAGATGAYQSAIQHPAVTEVRCGGGIFGDSYYTNICNVNGLSATSTVLATVISRSALDRAVINVGKTSIGTYPLSPQVTHTVLGRPLLDARVLEMSADQTTLELGTESQALIIGDKIEVTPGLTSATSILHKQFHFVRNRIITSIEQS